MRAALLLLATATLFAADAPKVVNEGYGDFLIVPAGNFKMGDNFGDGESRERPVHQVHLDTFYIGKFEVTNGDWKKFQSDPLYNDVKIWPTGRVVPKDVLEEKMYGFGEEVTSNSVEVHVSRLRKRLSKAGATLQVHTLRGVGYLISDEAPR